MKRLLRTIARSCQPLLEAYFLYRLSEQRLLAKLLDGDASQQAERILKKILSVDHETRSELISKYATPLFGGLHPKNVFNYRFQFFLENTTSQDIVLDLACGTGAILARLAPQIKKGYGIELAPQNLSLCNSVHAASNIQYIEDDIFKVDYSKLLPKLGITTVIYSHILEHIAEPVKFIQLTGANKILICVPSLENWLAQLKIRLGLSFLTDPGHFREYSRDSLQSEVQQAGYTVRSLGFNSEGEIVCAAQRARPAAH